MPDNVRRRRGPKSFASQLRRKPEPSPEPEPDIQPLAITPLGRHEHVEKYFDVSANTIDRWIREEGLPVIRLGGTVRFDLAEVRAWALRRQLQQTKSEGKAEETA